MGLACSLDARNLRHCYRNQSILGSIIIQAARAERPCWAQRPSKTLQDLGPRSETKRETSATMTRRRTTRSRGQQQNQATLEDALAACHEAMLAALGHSLKGCQAAIALAQAGCLGSAPVALRVLRDHWLSLVPAGTSPIVHEARSVRGRRGGGRGQEGAITLLSLALC